LNWPHRTGWLAIFDYANEHLTSLRCAVMAAINNGCDDPKNMRKVVKSIAHLLPVLSSS